MSDKKNARILELFSGIGGMHFAFKESGVPGDVVRAIDINTIANSVYNHNFPCTTLINGNILKLSEKDMNSGNFNTILMSPPCQPFTRVGKFLDLHDQRTNVLIHLCNNLQYFHAIKYILLENVKGFEKSETRELFINSLKKCSFHYQEFLISPLDLGIPNQRLRYYCLARKTSPFHFATQNVLDYMPNNKVYPDCYPISKIINHIPDDKLSEYQLSDDVLKKRIMLLDICHPDSTKTMCFTKAYTKYTEGTGSIYCPLDKTFLNQIFDELKMLDKDSDDLSLIQKLNLRYFTPNEISNLMCFPKSFSFPQDIKLKNQYKLLGNSLNVYVVSQLIRLLFSDD